MILLGDHGGSPEQLDTFPGPLGHVTLLRQSEGNDAAVWALAGDPTGPVCFLSGGHSPDETPSPK